MLHHSYMSLKIVRARISVDGGPIGTDVVA